MDFVRNGKATQYSALRIDDQIRLYPGFDLAETAQLVFASAPAYKALKDLGRLYKTDYILRYVADPELRATVEGMLTQVEHGNKFSSAVTLGNNQAFGWQTQREGEIAIGCRLVIMNTINLYNLLYLSEKLRQCAGERDRQELLTTTLKSSTHTWHHINLGGEYDFSDSTVPASFDLDMLMSFPLSRPITTSK